MHDLPGHPGRYGSKLRTTATTLQQTQSGRNLENGPINPDRPRGGEPRPHKDTEGTLGEYYANFQLLRPNSLGGDSAQSSKIGPEFA